MVYNYTQRLYSPIKLLKFKLQKNQQQQQQQILIQKGFNRNSCKESN